MELSITQAHRLLTTPTPKAQHQVKIWFSLSLTFAAIYGCQWLQQAFKSEYVVAKDAREYVFWMQRFVDQELLPHDLIADYFQSITPSGYAAFYQVMASLGISPLLLSKILPMVLGLIVTAYCFGVCLQLFAVPAAGFIASLLLNQSLWFRDDLASATPRAFVYPLFLAFLYYLLRRSFLPCLVVIALQGLFYPPLGFISAGILFVRLWDWQRWPPRIEQNRSNFLLCVAGLGVACLVMLPYALATSKFGPLVTAVQARAMPEFWPGGRHPFFQDNPGKFWLVGQHSGLLPPLLPPLIWTGLLLPVLLRNPSRFPLVRQVKSVTVLPQIVLVSLGLFLAAHALWLKLFFPSRYTGHTLRVVMAIAAGIALVVMLDAVLHACTQLVKSRKKRQLFWVLAATGLLGTVLVLYPHFSGDFPKTNYRVSGEGALYEFLQQQPKNILIATLSDEANNIPTFAHRSILVSKEYALPFHLGYYRQIRQRAIDLIRAQYSPNLAVAKSFVQKYGVNFWLLNREAFTPEYVTSSWFTQYQPATTEALAVIKQDVPALSRLTKRCAVFETGGLVVLQAKCIANAPIAGR